MNHGGMNPPLEDRIPATDPQTEAYLCCVDALDSLRRYLALPGLDQWLSWQDPQHLGDVMVRADALAFTLLRGVDA